MKPIYLHVLFSVIFINVIIFDVSALNISNTLTDKDKMIFAEYDQKYRDHPVEDLAITHLISDHIQSASPRVVGNGFQLIYRLADKHKKYFDDVVIGYLLNEIQTGITYKKYLEENANFLTGFLVLGETRSEKSIEVLLQLMEPYENWPLSFKNPLENNPDQKRWITKIRKYALDSLLEPKDKKGEELLSIIKAKLNGYQTNKPGFAEMKDSYDFYKTYYAELKQGIDRFSLDHFNKP